MKLTRKQLRVGILLSSLMVILPLIYGQTAIFNGFGVELWIGNAAPTVKFDPGTSSSLAGVDPTAASSTRVHFIFNVTDTNGEDDIDETGTRFNITLGTPGGSQWRSNSSCTNISKISADNVVVFNCSVYLQYYDNASSNWILNVTVSDSSSATANNDSENFVYNELSSLDIPVQWINFTSLTLGAANQPTGGAQLVLNNTGNDDFDQINVSASSLIGVDVPADTISSSSFVVNSSSTTDGAGTSLTDGALTIPSIEQSSSTASENLTLPHGWEGALDDYNDNVISAKGNQTLFFWVDVPTGIQPQKYNNTWNLTVIDIP